LIDVTARFVQNPIALCAFVAAGLGAAHHRRIDSRGKLLSTLSSPAILLANHAAPSRQALGGILLHPLGKLRRAHQSGLHRDISEVRGGDGLLVAICRRGETAKHGDDLYHDRRTPRLRWALVPLIV